MTNKQIEFLDKINEDQLNSESDKFLTGTKYKNGNATIDAHDLSQEQWMELVSMDDYPGLWHDVSMHLAKK